jgi:mannose-1-phosphate guanylyltransferase
MSRRNHIIAGRENSRTDSAIDVRPNRVALLLAGGDGMRLQELTSQIAGVPIPKQYCRLMNGVSMLEATISRANVLFPLDHINVILNRNHMDLAKEQVSILPEENIFVQPLNRDTGPGMVFALLNLARTCRDATVAVFPTDHYIDKSWTFIVHVMRAMIAVASVPDKIAILGIAPDRPETGYGYILPSTSLGTSGKTYHVGAFIEKPNLATAQELIVRGGLWNTFIMIFRLSRMLELLHEIVPREVEALCEICGKPNRELDAYRTIQPWNFSTHVLSRIPQHLIVQKVGDVSWSDWGTRESIERTFRALNLVPSWGMIRANGSRDQADEPVREFANVNEPEDYTVPQSR